METTDVLPVPRTKAKAKEVYDRISPFYDSLTGPFEREFAKRGLDRLSVEKGEEVLEIGFGPGRCLLQIAERVGPEGRAYGIDLSHGMIEVSRRRLEKAGLWDRVEICCGDAVRLPFRSSAFDAVFMSFTLELFDTPEIPEVLREVRRVLRTSGRVGIVSMSKEDGDSFLVSLYEWGHRRWPKYLDCRPIYVERSMTQAGYEIKERERPALLGMPAEIVIGVKP